MEKMRKKAWLRLYASAHERMGRRIPGRPAIARKSAPGIYISGTCRSRWPRSMAKRRNDPAKLDRIAYGRYTVRKRENGEPLYACFRAGKEPEPLCAGLCVV